MTGCIMTRGLCYSVITAVITSFPLVKHILGQSMCPGTFSRLFFSFTGQQFSVSKKESANTSPVFCTLCSHSSISLPDTHPHISYQSPVLRCGFP